MSQAVEGCDLCLKDERCGQSHGIQTFFRTTTERGGQGAQGYWDCMEKQGLYLFKSNYQRFTESLFTIKVLIPHCQVDMVCVYVNCKEGSATLVLFLSENLLALLKHILTKYSYCFIMLENMKIPEI